MADLVAMYAQAHPHKPAVVDDRPGGDVRTLTWAELDGAANRLANVLIEHGATTGSKLVWCGQNSTGVVVLFSAARKVGVTLLSVRARRRRFSNSLPPRAGESGGW